MTQNERTNRRLFLHIGTHKTGSTSIQHFLFEHRNALMKQGFYYPCEGSYYFYGEKSQGPLAFSLLDHWPQYFHDKVVPGKQQCISEIRRDIAKSGCQNIIVSSEHFSIASSELQWQSIRQVFAPVVDDIRIIVYLRRQDTKLESQWTQWVKSGSFTGSLEELGRQLPGQDYFKFLSSISGVFAKSDILVRPFEPGQMHQGSVVNDFLKLVGITADAPIPSRLNKGPSVDRVEAIRLLNKTLGSYAQRELLGRVLASLETKGEETRYALFTPEKRRAFLDAFRESNSLVARHFLNRSDGVLFQDDTEDNNLPVYPGLSIEKLAAISADALVALAEDNRKLVSRSTANAPRRS